MNNDKITLIPIKDIQVKSRLRMVDEKVVEALSVDIGNRGLKSPIEVVKRPKGAGYRLVCGGHRLAAMSGLGWEEAPAFIVTGTSSELRMAEALENIVRSELTYLERSQSVKVIKIEWMHENPDRTHGGKRQAGAIQDATDETWTSVVAQRTGWGERTLALSAQIGFGIDDRAAALLFGTDAANNQKELLAIIKYSPEVQRDIAKVIASGEASTVFSAAALVIPSKDNAETKTVPVETQVARITKSWAKADDDAKRAFVEVLREEGFI